MPDKNTALGEQDATDQADQTDQTDEAVAAGQAVAETDTDESLSDEESLQKKLKEVVQVKVEDIGPLRKQVSITVPRDAIDEQLHEQFDELRQEANVPGFRRGRAPMKLIEKRFGHEVGDQVSSSLIGNSYMAAIDRESLKVLGDPLVRVTVTEKRTGDDGTKSEVEVEKLVGVEEALKHLKLPKDGDLSYVCEVEVKPEFDLPKLEQIPVEKPQVTIGDTEIDAEIKRRMALRGTFKPVESGKTQADDVLVGTAKIIVDGETIDTEENAELAVRDQTYGGLPLTGFGKAATGRKLDEPVAIDVTIPDDYVNVGVRGKKALFELAVRQVKRLEVPELDDEYLASLGFDSRDEFRDLIRDQMERAVAQEVRRAMFHQVERYLLDNTKVEVPKGISQNHGDRIASRRMMELYSRGVSEAEISKHADELRTSAAEQAADEIRYLFIMGKIAEEQEVNVSEEEINAAIAEIAHRRNRRFDRVRDEIIGTNHLMTLYTRLRDEKIMARLLDDAKVTEKTVAETTVAETTVAETKPATEAEPKAKKPAAKKSAAKNSADKAKPEAESQTESKDDATGKAKKPPAKKAARKAPKKKGD